MKRRYPDIYFAGGADNAQFSKQFNASEVDWNHPLLQRSNKMFTVNKIPCVDLKEVLEVLKISHINLFILDVEGTEVSVLKSIDFSKTLFDVIVVERQTPNEAIKFMKSLTEYELVAAKGRNLWYMRRLFMPSRRSSVGMKCYRGCLRARGSWRCAHSHEECKSPP